MNPQFFVNLTDPDPEDDEDKCPVVISLAQKQKLRRSEKSIGFKIYKCGDDKVVDENFLKRNQSVKYEFSKQKTAVKFGFFNLSRSVRRTPL